MKSNKESTYLDLVARRKRCTRCKPELTNPSCFPELDVSEIGAWSIWQNSLDADILLVGQDWGGVKHFKRHRGRDVGKNPTNRNLSTLFRSIGISLEAPERGKKNPSLFFTNVILCLKKGGLTDPVKQKFALTCCSEFLIPLIKLIEPKVVIGVGKFAYEAIAKYYHLKVLLFKEAVEYPDGFPLGTKSQLFPVFHCGAYGWNVNRKGPGQIGDWKKIGSYLAAGFPPSRRPSTAR